MEIKNLSDQILKINKSKKINCSTCNKVAKEPYHPFCSKKCADIDLTKWLIDEKN